MMVGNPNECRLRVGGVMIAIEAPSPEYAASLRHYFATDTVDGDPDVTLRLTIVSHDDRPGVPDSLFNTKRLTPEGFDVDNGLATGCFDPASGTGELRVKNLLTKGPLTRVFEQLLYQGFYSAARRTSWPALLVHSSGVIRDGAGYLFVGESGAGKSTVAALSAGGPGQVINDEICCVEFGPSGAVLHSTPFNGLFRDKQAGSAPLRAVFLLAHGDAHRIEEVNPGSALPILTGQVVAPLPLEEQLSAATSTAMLDGAARLLAAAPVRRLLFTPDEGFWPVVLEGFPPGKRNA